MKSRILSFRGLLETWKKQLWVFALACLTYFIIYPVSGMLAIDRWMEYRELARIPGAYRRLLVRWLYGSPRGDGEFLSLILVAAVCMGVLCGINGMSYLHSRKKVDFYHSLPERREALFFSQVLAGSATYLIASAAGMLILMMVAVARGAFSLAGFGAGLASVLVGYVLFLMGYALAALAMLLTGRVLVGILGTAVFFGFIPLLKLLKEGLCESFFTNYMPVSARFLGHDAWSFGSPFGWAYNISTGLNGGDGWLMTLLAAVVTAFLLALGIWVYRMRPSEAAGTSMAFGRAAAVIKVALTVTGALAMSLFFRDITSESGAQDFWFAFGLIFGLLLFYAVIQMIYYLNIRKLFAGRATLLISVLLTAAAALIVRSDLLGYNDYLPKQEELAELDILTEEEFLDGRGASLNGGPQEALDSMKMKNSGDLYQLAAKLLESSRDFAGHDTHVYGGPARTVYVKYVTDRGSEAYRCYRVFAADVRGEIACLYDHPEFLEAINGRLFESDPEDVTSVEMFSLDKASEDESWGFYRERDEGRSELVEALRSDVKTLNSRVAAGETPVGILYLYYKIRPENMGSVDEELSMAAGEYYSVSCEVPVYASYAKTLAILNKKGYRMPAQIDPDSVKEIRIDDFRSEESPDAMDAVAEPEQAQEAADAEENDVQVIRDRAQIDEILGAAVERRFASLLFEYEEDVSVDIVFKEGTLYGSVVLRKDKLPDFLK